MYITQTIIEDGKEYEVITYDGKVYWVLNGKYHREKGPAYYECDGYKTWCQNELYHRLDGPAEIGSHGTKRWWISNRHITKHQHIKIRTILSLGLDKI